MVDSRGSLASDPHPFRHLHSEQIRAAVIRLRDSVTPLLANNILSHFTDHSVTHSDNVCGLIDDLIYELQKSPFPLSQGELGVMYSACYTHDSGMQYENAGQTAVVLGLNLAIPWNELADSARKELLRQYHHLISAELVAASVGSAAPPLGIQLDDVFRPTLVARLCEAHCVTPGTDRYRDLMQDVPGFRMPLLSGLLRLADILDESRHRACRHKAETLLLNLESQTHWWRHYFTKDILINAIDKTITIWFEFPRDRGDEYQRVIPSLQIPWIKQELENQREVFGQLGLSWTLAERTELGPYSNVESMPDTVMTQMVKQLRWRRVREEEQAQAVSLQAFKEARPLVERRLKDLSEQKEKMPADRYIQELATLAGDLWDLGNQRSAWMTLSNEFELSFASLTVAKRTEIGGRLLRMLMDDDVPEMARAWVQRFNADLLLLPAKDALKSQLLRLIARWYLEMGGYDEAVQVFRQAMESAPDLETNAEVIAELSEAHLLRGNIAKAIEEFKTI